MCPACHLCLACGRLDYDTSVETPIISLQVPERIVEKPYKITVAELKQRAEDEHWLLLADTGETYSEVLPHVILYQVQGHIYRYKFLDKSFTGIVEVAREREHN